MDGSALSPQGEESAHQPHAPARVEKPLAAFKGDTSEILQRLRDGDTALNISRELGIHHTKLYAWLLRHSPEEWREISAGKALARIEQAEADMDDASDNVQISKARESHRMGAWALERVARNLYGDTKSGTGDVTVQVLIARDGLPTVTVEQS